MSDRVTLALLIAVAVAVVAVLVYFFWADWKPIFAVLVGAFIAFRGWALRGGR